MAKHGPAREHQFQSINRTKTSQTGSNIADNNGTGGVSVFTFANVMQYAEEGKRHRVFTR